MERKLLQIVVGLAGFAAVGFGFAGVLFGTTLLGLSDDVVIDSSVRFLKGKTLVIGLIFVPLLWLWQRHVAGIAGRTAIT